MAFLSFASRLPGNDGYSLRILAIFEIPNEWIPVYFLISSFLITGRFAASLIGWLIGHTAYFFIFIFPRYYYADPLICSLKTNSST